MRFPVEINKLASRVNIPKQVIRQGFVGKTELIVGPLALVIVKPGTADVDLIQSLEITIQSLRLAPSPPPATVAKDRPPEQPAS